MAKKDVVHIYTIEYYSAMRKEDILPFMTRMDLEHIVLDKVSQTEKDKHCTISLICRI